MQKTLSLIAIMMIAFSPLVWAEDEVTMDPLVPDTVAVVETVSDAVAVDVSSTIDGDEQELVVDISSSSEIAPDTDQTISALSLPIISDEIYEWDATPIPEEAIMAPNDVVTLAEPMIQWVEDIQHIQEIDPDKEENPDDIIVSDTDTRTISIDSWVITISWK